MPVQTNGTVVSGTIDNLVAGLRSRPMSREAVGEVFDQSARFTESIVELYDSSVARGEVGDGGTGRATDLPIIGHRPATALLYGRVQSGKTAAMVLTSALALDNGFRIIVVLTADNVELVRQTANRFKDLDGPRVLSTLKEDDTAEWRAPDFSLTETGFLEDVAQDGLVFVCAKNALHLPQVLVFLQSIDAAAYPCLIFDDEADAATPDHTLQARTSGRRNAPALPSTIHRRVVRNEAPNEEGESALEILPHSVYVQVTATPYVLFLQRVTSTIHPSQSMLLEPGSGYCGGERFFGAFDVESQDTPAPPLVIVSDSEAQALLRRPVPTFLAASIDFAIVAAATRNYTTDVWPDGGFKHLSHTSRIVDDHTLVSNHIERHLRELRRELRDDLEAAKRRLELARQELGRSCVNAPSIDELLPNIHTLIRQAQVIRVNARVARPPYGPRINFLVGGNILGRGLTIDDLLVTYYLRQAQVSQMDTVLQHARMYGYRDALMPFTRVFVPRQLAILFKSIHDSEQSLRSIVERRAAGQDVPVRVARGARATRPGALETGAIRVYDNSGQVSPHYPIRDPVAADSVHRLLTEYQVPLEEEDRQRRATRVPYDVARELVSTLEPREDDPGRWSVDAVLGLLSSYEDAYADGVVVYARKFDREPDEDRTRARLSGPEVQIVRQAAGAAPALALLYWDEATEPELWYPTLVVPRNMDTFVFCPP